MVNCARDRDETVKETGVESMALRLQSLGNWIFVPYTIKREVGYFLGKYPRYIPTYATYIYIYMGGLYIIMVVWEMWGNILGTTASVPF